MAYRLGDLNRECRESNSLGIARREAGDVAGAAALIESSLALARQIGDPQREAKALSNLVDVHMDAGDYAAAVAAGRVAIAADSALARPVGRRHQPVNLILALLNAEGPHRAHEHLVEIGERVFALGDIELSIDHDRSGCMRCGPASVMPRARLGWWGRRDSQRENVGIPRGVPDHHHLERFIEPVRSSSSRKAWDHEYEPRPRRSP